MRQRVTYCIAGSLTSSVKRAAKAERDIEVAVAALTEDGHAGRVHELTGPRALTFAEAVAEIGRAAGRELRYVPIPMDAFVSGAVAEGVPPDVVSLLSYLFTEVLVDANAHVADGVREALRPRAARVRAVRARCRRDRDLAWVAGGAGVAGSGPPRRSVPPCTHPIPAPARNRRQRKHRPPAM
jgi:hypothetical protein